MTDDNTQTGSTQDPQTGSSGGAGAAVKDVGGIVIDKKKSPEQYMEEAEAKYIIPKLVRDKFPDLVKLIFETESMNKEEREYWLQIMPIMTEVQIEKFRGILVNEKDQLAKLDKEYEQEMSKVNQKNAPVIDEAKLKEKQQKIKQAENAYEEAEAQKEADLLKKLEGL